MLNKMRFATNTVAALAVTAILACLLLPRLGSTYGAAGTDKRQPSEMEPLAFSPGHWMNYLSQAWGGHTQAAGIPSEFRYVLLGLLSGNTSGTSYQFPSSTGPRNFSVQGWFYACPAVTHVGSKAAGRTDERLSFVSFITYRDGPRFMMLLDLSGRGLLYFCSTGSSHLTALLPIVGGKHPVLWTPGGGAYYHSYLVQEKRKKRFVIRFGYNKVVRKTIFRFVGPRELTLLGCQGSTELGYHAFRRFIVGLGETGRPNQTEWFVAGLSPPRSGRGRCGVGTYQWGEVTHERNGGFAAKGALYLVVRNVRKATEPAFLSQTAGLSRDGVRAVKVSSAALAAALRRLEQGPLLLQPSLGAAAPQRRVVEPFLSWVGGGASSWYKSPRAKYARATILASVTPLAGAWDSAKRRFKKGFVHPRQRDRKR